MEDSKKDIELKELNEDLIIFNSDGIGLMTQDKKELLKQVSNIDILSLCNLKNMSLEYYIFKLSGGFLSLIHNIDYYLSIRTLLKYLLSPVVNCKRKVEKIRKNLNDHDITINTVYFRFTSPLRNGKNIKNQLVYGVNERNIKDVWKIYEQEFKEKPKIGDSIEVNYTVPYERTNPHYHLSHTSYIVSYTYPSNVHFPPYKLNSLRNYDLQEQYKNGILFATCGEKDFTDRVIKIAGPFGNFYSDLPSRYGVQIHRNLIVDDDEKEELVITDNNADEFKFESNSLIKI